MKNVIDLVHMKTKIKRDIVATVVTETLNLTKETLKAGSEVFWPGLCKFEWKKTSRGKKPKVVAEEKTEAGFVDGKGFEDLVIEDPNRVIETTKEKVGRKKKNEKS